MSNSHYLPDNLKAQAKAMIFVDGENLAIRFKERIGSSDPQSYVDYDKNIFVWSKYANIPHHVNCEVVRKYYYTAVQGDTKKLEEVEDKLKEIGIEAPRIFKKKKGKSSKRVDITLATEMLTHAQKGNYDIAILVAGDDDYVPLVKAVKDEGCRVVLWFFEKDKGLSRNLRLEADYFFDISWFLEKPQEELKRFYNW